MAVRQALLAHAAAHGRRCPDCRTVRDTARYAGVTTLAPASMEPTPALEQLTGQLTNRLTNQLTDQDAPPWGNNGGAAPPRKPENE